MKATTDEKKCKGTKKAAYWGWLPGMLAMFRYIYSLVNRGRSDGNCAAARSCSGWQRLLTHMNKHLSAAEVRCL